MHNALPSDLTQKLYAYNIYFSKKSSTHILFDFDEDGKDGLLVTLGSPFKDRIVRILLTNSLSTINDLVKEERKKNNLS